MPTKKPVVQTVLEERYYIKLKKIAEENGDRKISDQARRIIENYIDNYEKENGNIIISGNTNFGDININQNRIQNF